MSQEKEEERIQKEGRVRRCKEEKKIRVMIREKKKIVGIEFGRKRERKTYRK